MRTVIRVKPEPEEDLDKIGLYFELLHQLSSILTKQGWESRVWLGGRTGKGDRINADVPVEERQGKLQSFLQSLPNVTDVWWVGEEVFVRFSRHSLPLSEPAVIPEGQTSVVTSGREELLHIVKSARYSLERGDTELALQLVREIEDMLSR